MHVRNHQGQALVLALIVMMILFFLTVSILDIGVNYYVTSYNQIDKAQAYYNADAGIERILAKIAGEPEWITNDLYLNQNSRFNYEGVTVTVQKQMDFEDTILYITSVGYHNQAKQSLQASVKVSDPVQIMLWSEMYPVLPD